MVVKGFEILTFDLLFGSRDPKLKSRAPSVGTITSKYTQPSYAVFTVPKLFLVFLFGYSPKSDCVSRSGCNRLTPGLVFYSYHAGSMVPWFHGSMIPWSRVIHSLQMLTCCQCPETRLNGDESTMLIPRCRDRLLIRNTCVRRQILLSLWDIHPDRVRNPHSNQTFKTFPSLRPNLSKILVRCCAVPRPAEPIASRLSLADCPVKQRLVKIVCPPNLV